MRKKLQILIPMLILAAFIAVAGTITIAGSAQPAASNLLDVQQQVVLDAISQKDFATADKAFDQMVKKFPRHKDISQSVYAVAREYGKLNKEKAVQIHQYNVTHYPESTYAMWSGVEMFKIHFDAGKRQEADTDVQTLIQTFANQPTLPKELYQIAARYNGAGKHTKANELYKLAATYEPDNIYVQLSQLFLDAKSNDITAAGNHITSLLEVQANNTKLAEELYNAAVNLGYENAHEAAIACYQQVITSFPDAGQTPYALQRMALEYNKLGDEDNARKTIDKLVMDYNDIPHKEETLRRLSQNYSEDTKMTDQEAEFYKYAERTNLKDDDYTMFSQVELVKYYIRTNDLAKGDTQYNRLVTEFSENKWLPSSICFIGDTYLRAGDVDLGGLLYNQVLTTWPNDPQTIYAKAGLAKIAGYLDQDSDANQKVDEIFTNYADNPYIASAVLGIAEEYNNIAMALRRDKNRNTDLSIPSNPFEKLPLPTEEAIAKFMFAKAIWERIISDMPDSSILDKANHYIAESYYQLRDYEKAIEYYKIVDDNWPDYKFAYHCRYMTVRLYQNLQNEGVMTEAQVGVELKDAYEKLLENHPDRYAAGQARSWLEEYARKQARLAFAEEGAPLLHRGELM